MAILGVLRRNVRDLNADYTATFVIRILCEMSSRNMLHRVERILRRKEAHVTNVTSSHIALKHIIAI